MRDVRAILGGVPGFETASVRAVLSDGPTNASYRVERDGMDLVLRVDKPAAAELGLDRSAEHRVLQALAVAGLILSRARRSSTGTSAAGLSLRKSGARCHGSTSISSAARFFSRSTRRIFRENGQSGWW